MARITLTGQNFKDLVSGRAVRATVMTDDIPQEPLDVLISLSDIGFRVMKNSIYEAEMAAKRDE